MFGAHSKTAEDSDSLTTLQYETAKLLAKCGTIMVIFRANAYYIRGHLRSSLSRYFQSQIPLPTHFTVLCFLQSQPVSFCLPVVFTNFNTPELLRSTSIRSTTHYHTLLLTRDNVEQSHF